MTLKKKQEQKQKQKLKCKKITGRKIYLKVTYQQEVFFFLFSITEFLRNCLQTVNVNHERTFWTGKGTYFKGIEISERRAFRLNDKSKMICVSSSKCQENA